MLSFLKRCCVILLRKGLCLQNTLTIRFPETMAVIVNVISPRISLYIN